MGDGSMGRSAEGEMKKTTMMIMSSRTDYFFGRR